MTDRSETAPHSAVPEANAWPAAAVAMRPIEELIPYARNSRTHSAEQIAQIAAAMREWGWTVPVLVDEAGMILAGHGRIMAARALGLALIPTMVAHGWSEPQKRAYVLADNKLALNAGWDPELLKLELHSLDEAGFRLDATGFTGMELSVAMFEPDFSPVGEDEQSRLDEKKRATCPECGHEFVPS